MSGAEKQPDRTPPAGAGRLILPWSGLVAAPPDTPLMPVPWLPGLPRPVLDVGLRLTAKRLLSGLKEPGPLRRSMEADAARFRHPELARYAPAVIEGPAGPMAGLWATAGGTGKGWPEAGPVILYLHGGAYIAGSPRTHRHLAAALAAEADGVAFLPDYRLAPEHQLPAALEDAEAAWKALRDAGIPARRIALAGDSAGGGLAAALLARLIAKGEALPGALVAFSPWADMTGEAGSLRAHARADAMLPGHRFEDLLDFCLPPEMDRADPRVSPAMAEFHAPPPAFITVGTREILTDDAHALAARLRAGGGEVELQEGHRLPHVWPVFRGWITEADATVAAAGAFIVEHCAAH